MKPKGGQNTKSTILTQIMTLNISNFPGKHLKSKDGRNSDHYLSYENILGCMRHFRVNKAQNEAKRGGQKHKIDYCETNNEMELL